MHVLGTPPALVLSQDQTLHRIRPSTPEGADKNKTIGADSLSSLLTIHPSQAEARMERSGNHTSSFAVIQLSKTRLLGQRPPFYVRELRLSTRNPFSRPARTRRRRGGCAPCTPVPRGLRYPSTASAARQHACTTFFRGAVPWPGSPPGSDATGPGGASWRGAEERRRKPPRQHNGLAVGRQTTWIRGPRSAHGTRGTAKPAPPCLVGARRGSLRRIRRDPPEPQMPGRISQETGIARQGPLARETQKERGPLARETQKERGPLARAPSGVQVRSVED